VGRPTSTAERTTIRKHVTALGGVVLAQCVDNILDEHHGAVDQDAEIDRAHRDQVGREAQRVEAEKSHQQGERYYHGDRHRAHGAARNSHTTPTTKNKPAQRFLWTVESVSPPGRCGRSKFSIRMPFGRMVSFRLTHLVVDAVQHPRGILSAPHPHETFDTFLF